MKVGKRNRARKSQKESSYIFSNITLKDKSGNFAKSKELTGEQINLLCQRIPDILSTHSTLIEMEPNSQLLNCRLNAVTSF